MLTIVGITDIIHLINNFRKSNMSKPITTTLNAVKPLLIHQHFLAYVDNGKIIESKIINHQWIVESIAMITYSGRNANKPNTSKARKLIINEVEFIEVSSNVFKTNPVGEKQDMYDFIYLYREEDFQ